jgi:hypothetical protein
VVARTIEQVVLGAIAGELALQPRVGQQVAEDDHREQGTAPERVRYQRLAPHADVDGRHEAQAADEPAQVPVWLGAVGRAVDLVGAPLPDRVDLHEAAERDEDGEDEQHEPERAQGVAGPHRRADRVALAAAGARELGVVVAGDEREVQRDERRHDRREDEDVKDVEPALDRARTRVLAIPGERADVLSEEGQRQSDAVGDGQAHAREQVVGQRVAGEALEDARAEQEDAEHPDRLARLAEGTGEEGAREVGDHRHDEDERGPVMGLADHQPGGDGRGDAQGRVVGGGDREARELAEGTGVGGRGRDVGREEERQVGAAEDEEGERVERDLAQEERPVLGEDVAQRAADEGARAQALVDEMDGVGHECLTPQ